MKDFNKTMMEFTSSKTVCDIKKWLNQFGDEDKLVLVDRSGAIKNFQLIGASDGNNGDVFIMYNE